MDTVEEFKKEVKEFRTRIDKFEKMYKAMEVINFSYTDAEYIYDNIPFFEALMKVIDGKARIHLELTYNKRVFDILCSDENTVYINQYSIKKTRYGRFNMIDHFKTANGIRLIVKNICDGL